MKGGKGFSVLQVMKFKQRLVVPAWLLTSPHHGYILSKRVLMYLRHVYRSVSESAPSQ